MSDEDILRLKRAARLGDPRSEEAFLERAQARSGAAPLTLAVVSALIRRDGWTVQPLPEWAEQNVAYVLESQRFILVPTAWMAALESSLPMASPPVADPSAEAPRSP